MKKFPFQILTPSLEISGGDLRFPVRRIFCVGRNYSDHAREFGNDERDPPFFFTKPTDAIVEGGASIPYPTKTKEVHHGTELVVAIGIGGSDISSLRAMTHIFGFAAGNDLTRRDLQASAKSQRHPWDMSKGFDNSAIIGPILKQNYISKKTMIRCLVNEEVRQTGQVAQMTWSISDIIAKLSSYLTLAPGNLIMTGTPAGVGPVAPGETCTVEVDNLSPAAIHLPWLKLGPLLEGFGCRGVPVHQKPVRQSHVPRCHHLSSPQPYGIRHAPL